MPLETRREEKVFACFFFSLWCGDHFLSSYNAARSNCDVDEMIVTVFQEDGRAVHLKQCY